MTKLLSAYFFGFRDELGAGGEANFLLEIKTTRPSKCPQVQVENVG